MPTMMNTQEVTFTLEPRLRNADGTPGEIAPVQPGSIVWATSDDTAIRVVTTDGMTGKIQGVSPNTDRAPASLSVTADADLGEGVVTITGVSDPQDPFIITQDPAALAGTFTMTFGAPQAKTP
jgi:hypothetical protein